MEKKPVIARSKKRNFSFDRVNYAMLKFQSMDSRTDYSSSAQKKKKYHLIFDPRIK